MLDKYAAFQKGFMSELKSVWKGVDPRAKASIGAALGIAAYGPVRGKLNDYLIGKIDATTPRATAKDPVAVEKELSGTALLRWVEKFRKEHPETKSVPVYVSGRIPVSQYISQLAFEIPGQAETMLREWGIKEPGVYLHELAAPIALHELGHVALDKKVPGLSVLTHGASSLALPLLAAVLLHKPSKGFAKAAPRLAKGMEFVEKYSPLIAAALQVPVLAEEAIPSIMAEKTLRTEGESGVSTLLPAWLSYVAGHATVPLATLAAQQLKRA